MIILDKCANKSVPAKEIKPYKYTVIIDLLNEMLFYYETRK
jgi:hypothetical protein